MSKRSIAAPTDLPDCVLWLDASDLASITKDGSDLVSQWNDKSAAANHFTASGTARPLYSSYQGNAILSFDGSTDTMVATSNIADAATGSTIIAVCRKRSAASGASKVVLGTQANALYLDAGAGSSWGGYTGGFKQAGEQPSTRVRVFSARRGLNQIAGQFKLRVDGVAKGHFTTGASEGRVTTDLGYPTQEPDMDLLATVVYQRSLSDGELALVEAYFNRKYQLYPTRELDTPLEVPDCVLWLDATDAASITKDGADLMSQWNDKSAAANHFVQATPASKPTFLPTGGPNGVGAVSFDGVDDHLAATSNITLTGGSIFAVVSDTTTASRGTLIAVNNYSFQVHTFNGVASFLGGIDCLLLRVNQLGFKALSVGFSSSAARMRLDGNTGRNVVGGSAARAATWIGNDPNLTTRIATMKLCELVVFNRQLTDGETALVEAYLARKYDVMPKRVIQAPTEIHDCALWLDATDLATVTMDGAGLVSQWADKSGNNKHAVQALDANKPTYSPTGLNGRACMDWGNGSVATRVMTTPAITIGLFTAFMVLRGDASAGYVYVHHSDTTNGTYVLGGFEASIRVNRPGGPGFSDKNVSATWLRDSVPKQVTTRFGGLHATHKAWVGGVAQNLANRPAATNFDPGFTTQSGFIYVGGNGIGTTWRGVIAELIIFTRELSDGERILVERYLAEKYGMQAN
jgi:hypothetical protein